MAPKELVTVTAAGIDVASADFDALLAAFPYLAPEALRDRCQSELPGLPQNMVAALDSDAASRPAAFRQAAARWARNNEEMVRLASDLRAGDRASALEKALTRRRAAMDADATWGGESEEFRQTAANALVAACEAAIDELAKGMTPIAGLPVRFIHRGGALPLADFEKCFAPGRTVTWDGLTACTISPDFVPLFFAHKSWTRLGSEPDVAAFLLDVELATVRSPTLAWTGDVQGGVAGNTYRWQAEVVTSPGFAFRVLEVLPLADGTRAAVFRVKAVEVD